jgi:hypothetical protein
MNLFRSEDHVTEWLAGRTPGITASISALSALAHAWWGDRLDPDWRPRSRDANQSILDSVGLTGPLWQLG